MEKLILYCLILLSCSSWAKEKPYPQINLNFLTAPPATLFYGETKRISMLLSYQNLMTDKLWTSPTHTSLELAPLPTDHCPWFGNDRQVYWVGTCHMNVIVNAHQFGPINGKITLRLIGQHNGYYWDRLYDSPYFTIKVIPHKLSMTTIPQQKATANTSFTYNIKSAINYYEENKLAGENTTATIEPASKQKLESIGLRFDPATLSISGTPNQTGVFEIKIGATNKLSTADYTKLTLNIGINPSDKPVFKTDNKNIPIATVSKKYSLNMMSLLKPNAGFMASNQIKFSIDPNQERPSWLKINPDNPILLEGKPEINDSGKEFKITLTATSNTGGASNPTLTLTIPVAYDPEKKPEIKPFALEESAGNQIHMDLSSYITDPAQDSSLKVIIESIIPKITWLHISPSNPLMLEGSIPSDVVGQTYLITLKADTKAGGPSNTITVPIQISKDKNLIPQFKNDNPVLNLVYPNQPYFYDFVEHEDIFPEYNDIPYTIKFADNSKNPSWLKIENNKLVAELVPNTVKSDFDIDLIIGNTPGGESTPITLSLTVM